MTLRSAMVLAFALALASPARGNGRYPAAQNLVFVPGAPDGPDGYPLVMAVQTTFGLVSTADGGATWHLTCEPAIGFQTEWDSTIVLAANGTAISGLPTGLATAPSPFCAFTTPASAPDDRVLDLTVDALGHRLVAAAASHGFALSDDDGVTWRRGWGPDNFLVATVDVAPGHPQRLYASGYLDGQSALLRSDDGGVGFAVTTRDFLGGSSPFIAAVSPLDPELLYLRIDLANGGTMLARSSDGGTTLHELIRTTNPMTGVAFTPDGRTMWAGSSGSGEHDGIFRSTDAGASWQKINDHTTPLCLRWRHDILYVCADDATDGFGIGYSRDGGATFAPLATWKALRGPEACPAASPGRTLCAGDWPALRATLVPVPDGGAAIDAPTIDATPAGADANPTDGGGAPASGGCACGAARSPDGGAAIAFCALLALLIRAIARMNWRQR